MFLHPFIHLAPVCQQNWQRVVILQSLYIHLWYMKRETVIWKNLGL